MFLRPVASLAKTAVDLVQDVQEKTHNLPAVSEEVAEELEDVLGAVKTVARRSDGLMQFVTSYRRLTRLPAPNKRTLSVMTLFDHVITLAKQR